MTAAASDITLAARWLLEAPRVIITAGAGMGVDSGLPDFRGPEGFWRAYPPIRKLGLQFHEISTPSWFDDDPCFAWGFFGHRLDLYRATAPHRGYDILRSWKSDWAAEATPPFSKFFPPACSPNPSANHAPAPAPTAGANSATVEASRYEGTYSKRRPVFVFTSNVDSHFLNAGVVDEEHLYEVNGNFRRLQCTRPDCGTADDASVKAARRVEAESSLTPWRTRRVTTMTSRRGPSPTTCASTSMWKSSVCRPIRSHAARSAAALPARTSSSSTTPLRPHAEPLATAPLQGLARGDNDWHDGGRLHLRIRYGVHVGQCQSPTWCRD